MTQRACPNWLDTFINLYQDTSPAPLSFIEWSGLFCISSVVKRRIEFSQEYLKSWRVYPNIYVIFVAPPGEAKKSTTAGLGMEVIAELLEGLTINDPAYVNIGQSSGSHIGIVESLTQSLDGSVSIVAGEFGTLASYTPVETYDFLSHMFDSDKIQAKFTHKTRSKGTESIVRPSVNLLGCTTPSWLSENAGYVIGGGFAARVVFVFEKQGRFRRLFSNGIGPSIEAQKKIKQKLAQDLKHLGTISGEMKPESTELAKKMDEWYQKIENFRGEQGTETFQARKHVHVLRNSMLMSLCERDDLIITEEHFERAKEQIARVEQKLGKGMAILGRNPYSGLLHTVLDYIEEHQPVAREKIMARFWQEFKNSPDQDLGMILETLKAMKEVECITVGTKEEWRKKK